LSDAPPTNKEVAPPPASGRDDISLPFSVWWPLLAGVASGIALRLTFHGKPGDIYSPMTGAFIYLAPVIVGAVTVYFAETKKRRTWKYYAWAPFLANIAFITGTLVIMIEGFICSIIIAPLFALLGIVGGLIMGTVCRITKWPKQALMSLGVLPFVVGPLESEIALPARISTVERTVMVHAAPREVWRQVMNASAIRPEELDSAWIFRIGVPVPLAGTTRHTEAGAVRRVTMGKQVYFDEVITEAQENRFVRWEYRFYKDSFPPQALDDHVVIGGHYFDVVDTSYALAPAGDLTALSVRIRYRVSTRFNWYAEPVAQVLLGNMAEVNLDFYRSRSERKP
jgi:hypothetical protein